MSVPDPSHVSPSFVVGEIYDRRSELHKPYGGGWQSGISSSSLYPLIFLFAGHSGTRHGYADRPEDDGTFIYTGEGQRGDMKMTRGNLAILQHSMNAKALHLFRTLKKGAQRYVGEFVYGGHEWIVKPDTDGLDRNAIVFRLVPIGHLEHRELLDEMDASEDVSLEEARRRAIAAAKVDGSSNSKSGSRTVYERSRAVRDYVLRRSQGVCELCAKPAPFRRAGGAEYLEPHHTTRVSDGGPDHPKFVAALCPTCHREVHYGEHAKAKNAALIERLQVLEP